MIYKDYRQGYMAWFREAWRHTRTAMRLCRSLATIYMGFLAPTLFCMNNRFVAFEKANTWSKEILFHLKLAQSRLCRTLLSSIIQLGHSDLQSQISTVRLIPESHPQVHIQKAVNIILLRCGESKTPTF
ncbi:hypothetical protein CI102_2652 [Trichoderma harzianum]|nr:hypothetical protein CI102_2652 [Trichoderma harzianum]